MGIPKYFRFITNKYPDLIIDKLNTINNINNDNNIDWCKNEIDTEWSIMLNETIDKLDENIVKLTKNIDDINNFKRINNQLLKEIKESNTPDKNWENKIDKIKNNIKNIIYLQ